MKSFRILSRVAAMAGVGTLLLFTAPAVSGQRPVPPAPDLMVLAGPGAEIGVTVRDIDPTEADRLKLAGGAFLEDVRPESPADKAGLKRGDVVVEFDGEKIRSARQFSRMVEETPPGRSVRAAVVRDGQRKDVQVTPSADRHHGYYFDSDRFRAGIDDLVGRLPDWDLKFDYDGFNPRGQLGATVNTLTPQLASYFGAKEGVLVVSVADDSAAARAGLKAGDVITSIDGDRVTSRGDLVRGLRNSASGEVTIGIVRDKKETTLKAKVEPRPRQRAARPA